MVKTEILDDFLAEIIQLLEENTSIFLSLSLNIYNSGKILPKFY